MARKSKQPNNPASEPKPTRVVPIRRAPASAVVTTDISALVPESPPISTKEPTEAEIRQRAYEIYQRRHGAAGDPFADWVQAERELREERRLPLKSR